MTVPLPDSRDLVTDALMAAILLKRGETKQLTLDLNFDDGAQAMEARWRDVAEKEKRSRARFAQNAMKPQEVAAEWEKARKLLGSPAETRDFVARAMTRFGVALEPRKSVLLAHVSALEGGLRDRLREAGLAGSLRLAEREPAPTGARLLTRTHPLTAILGETLVEASLDPETLPGLGIGRVGAWPTAAVTRLTRLALLRIRFKLTTHARTERLLLAEEAALVAFEGDQIIASDAAARLLLEAEASTNLAPAIRDKFIAQAQATLPALLQGPIARFAQERAEALMQDHARLRKAAGGASRVAAEAVDPPDVIGLFTLLPDEE